MIDETDPVVRAIQAPFEANMGDFYRRVKDANASYQEEMDKLDKEIAEREEKLRQLKEGEQQPEQPAAPAKQQQQEWDYGDPLASTQPEPRRWPSSLPSPQHASARQESTSDDEDPVYERRRYRATWAEPAREPEPQAQPWSPPPAEPPSPPSPSPARQSRTAARDDEDYSNESWLQ